MISKILVIPSWYPTTHSPATGTFCREQSELVADRFGLRILYPILRLFSKKDTLTGFRMPASAHTDDALLGNIPGVLLEAHTSSFLPEEKRIRFLIAQCADHLRGMIAAGWKPDILHAHGTIYGGIVASALGRTFGIRTVITEHHSLLVADFNALRWNFYRSALESSDLVLAVSNELKKMILMNGVRCNIAVTGNLLDEELFTFRGRKSESTTFQILFIAVPARTKDVPTFIRALQQLKRSGAAEFKATLIIPDVKADLTREEIMEMCREKGIAENCLFLGSVPHEHIPEIIHSCDALVSTSITETFGLSVAEALICGIPVIATRSGGVEDFVNSKNGLLVDIGDAEAIAAGLRQLIDGSFGINPTAVREEMVGRFGKKAFANRICDIYNNLNHS
jgi:glycosyltransferase involved in cell wall biosynthesis